MTLELSAFGATNEERLRYVLMNSKQSNIIKHRIMDLYPKFKTQIDVLVDALLNISTLFYKILSVCACDIFFNLQ